MPMIQFTCACHRNTADPSPYVGKVPEPALVVSMQPRRKVSFSTGDGSHARANMFRSCGTAPVC
eukprot:6202513-Pleurochrysis_carterae.AAC.3